MAAETVVLEEVATSGTRPLELAHADAITCLAARSPVLACGFCSGDVEIHSLSSSSSTPLKRLRGHHHGGVLCCTFSLSQRSLLLTGGADGCVRFHACGGADDPLVPDWQNLEKTGVLPKLREARAAIYAPGSLPKLRTALNHWLHFTATKARVGFLRPRINDDPGAFLTESLLRQSFVTHLVTSGCNVDTAEQYASLFNSWHVDTMGYGIVASKSFDDEQFKRTNQGLRRLHPATKIDRAAHPIEVNARVLRKNLDRVMAVYDEPGPMTPARWKRIEEELSVGAPQAASTAS